MNEMREYQLWREQATEDANLTAELQSIEGNEKEIRDRFYKELEFGTGGLRGILGAGTNRMNIYTVRKATQGFAEYINSRFPNASVAVAFDSRINSRLFAQETASVFAANGIKVYIYKEIAPTPMLSFAVRRLGCSGGVIVTASHNPSEYNGYKAYGPDGCQASLTASEEILSFVDKVNLFTGVKRISFADGMESGKIQYVPQEVLQGFYEAVLSRQLHKELDKDHLKVVYTPLNGAGNIPVRTVFERMGVENVFVVPQQEKPDGRFPTCPYPNPEIKEALSLGIQLAQEKDADIVIATDPDCDRVGTAVKTTSGYMLISGNEMGILLFDYIVSQMKEKGTLPGNPLAVTTIVSTPMTQAVADEYGVELLYVLTGFKFIGEQITLLEEKEQSDRFVFGYEESYGYLSGTHVRDKDAVVSSMLIAEMAAYYKSKGQTLRDRMNELCKQYGNYLQDQSNFTCKGEEGMKRMKEIMDQLISDSPVAIAGRTVLEIADYRDSIRTIVGTGKREPIGLPASDVVGFKLEGNAQVMVRPSGTEPKIKVYYTAVADSAEKAAGLMQSLKEDMTCLMGLED